MNQLQATGNTHSDITRKISINGSKYAYIDTGGTKPAMVYIHGLPTSKELFVPLIGKLRDDYRCIAVDLLDYGQSDRLERHIEHKERAADLKLFFEDLKLTDIILVCHDLGASVVMDLMTIAAQRISRLIVMSPPVYPDFRMPSVVRIVRSRVAGPFLISLMKNLLLARSLEKGLVNKGNYTHYLKEYLERSFQGQSGSRALLRNLRWGTPPRVFADYPAVIRSISQPALVIQGLSDPFIPLEHAERMARDIPESRLVLIKNAGHFLPIDVPEALEVEIRTFLSG